MRTEMREKTIYVTDTVTVEIPMQTAERIAKDSASHLENDYAMSDVRLNADGTLYHHLSTKPQKKPVEIQKPIQQRDSIVYRYIIRNVKKTVVNKERLPLTWWEKTRIYGFYLLLVWVCLKYRKQVVSIMKAFVKWVPFRSK